MNILVSVFNNREKTFLSPIYVNKWNTLEKFYYTGSEEISYKNNLNYYYLYEQNKEAVKIFRNVYKSLYNDKMDFEDTKDSIS